MRTRDEVVLGNRRHSPVGVVAEYPQIAGRGSDNPRAGREFIPDENGLAASFADVDCVTSASKPARRHGEVSAHRPYSGLRISLESAIRQIQVVVPLVLLAHHADLSAPERRPAHENAGGAEVVWPYPHRLVLREIRLGGVVERILPRRHVRVRKLESGVADVLQLQPGFGVAYAKLPDRDVRREHLLPAVVRYRRHVDASPAPVQVDVPPVAPVLFACLDARQVARAEVLEARKRRAGRRARESALRPVPRVHRHVLDARYVVCVRPMYAERKARRVEAAYQHRRAAVVPEARPRVDQSDVLDDGMVTAEYSRRIRNRILGALFRIPERHVADAPCAPHLEGRVLVGRRLAAARVHHKDCALRRRPLPGRGPFATERRAAGDANRP